jgi:hypothetical protein
VANPAFVIGGGPQLALPVGSSGPVAVGGTARTGLAFKLRRSRFWGFTLRAEVGVDIQGDQLAPAGGLMLGGGFSRPARSMQPTN